MDGSFTERFQNGVEKHLRGSFSSPRETKIGSRSLDGTIFLLSSDSSEVSTLQELSLSHSIRLLERSE